MRLQRLLAQYSLTRSCKRHVVSLLNSSRETPKNHGDTAILTKPVGCLGLKPTRPDVIAQSVERLIAGPEVVG